MIGFNVRVHARAPLCISMAAIHRCTLHRIADWSCLLNLDVRRQLRVHEIMLRRVFVDERVWLLIRFYCELSFACRTNQVFFLFSWIQSQFFNPSPNHKQRPNFRSPSSWSNKNCRYGWSWLMIRNVHYTFIWSMTANYVWYRIKLANGSWKLVVCG